MNSLVSAAGILGTTYQQQDSTLEGMKTDGGVMNPKQGWMGLVSEPRRDSFDARLTRDARRRDEV